MITSTDLAGVALFEGLTEEQIAECAALMSSAEVLMGEKLTKEDDYGYSFAVVLDGAVKVKVGNEVIAEIEAGDFFGEVSLVQHQKRNATVVASKTTHLAKVMTWNFDDFLAVSPLLEPRLTATAAQRLNQD